MPPAASDVVEPCTPCDGTVIDSEALAALLLLSVTCAVNVEVPGVPSGVPVIAPVDVSRLSPAGSEPFVIAHVYGPVPPDGSSVCEYDAFSGAFDSVPVPTASVSFVDVSTTEFELYATL